MDATRSLLISFSLYTYDGSKEKNGPYGGFPHPRDIADPPGVVKREWIPQTAGDQIWKLYEFETAEHRAAFMKNPPEVFAEAKCRTPKQAFYDHWVDHKPSSDRDWWEGK